MVDIELLKILITNPFITTNFLLKKTNLDRRKAISVIDKFVSLSILKHFGTSGQYLNDVFYCHDILSFLIKLDEKIFTGKEFNSEIRTS